MTIILELAAPGSHQWRVLDRGSAPSVGVENICWWIWRLSCMDCSCIILLGRGQFVFLFPKEESKASAGHLLSPCGFWVCTARCHWDLGSFCVPEHLWLQSRAAAKSHVQQDMDARASGRSTRCKVKKAFPRLHQLHKPVGAAAITVTPMSHFVCKLWVASPFFGGESSGGEQGNLDFVSTLALQFFPSCPLLPHLLRCVPSWRRTISCLHWD